MRSIRTAAACLVAAGLVPGAALFPGATQAEDPGEIPQPPRREEPRFSGMSFLDNGTIRLGVDLDLGGAITFLASSKDGVNVVNSHDLGRQIQMSFYSGPQPFAPGGKEPREVWAGLGWNPIQSGDCFDHRSRVIHHENDGTSLVVRCVPMHWPLENEPAHCTFESRIELEGNTVRARCTLVNDRPDPTQYVARSQELPAVYTNGFLHRLVTYDGERPFTGDEVTRIEKRWTSAEDLASGSPWASWYATEGWAALLNDDGWGLGIWTPGTLHYTGGFFGEPGSGGPADPPTGYMSPLHREVLDANIRYEYRYVLILGTLEQIRGHVYEHSPPVFPPDWRFEADRAHWHLLDCHDAGWPIEGELRVTLDGRDPRLVGPPGFWRAADFPRLWLDAAFDTGEEAAVLYWRRFGEGGFSAECSLAFPVIPDGRRRILEIDLSAAPAWRGVVTGLRLDPAAAGGEGRTARIRSISGIPPER